MQINILATAAGFVVEVSNFPFYKRYVRSDQFQVRELIETLLRDLEGAK